MATVTIDPGAHGPDPDWSAILQQAIDSPELAAGGTLRLRPGDYLLRRPIMLDRPHIRLAGEHAADTVLRTAQAFPALIIGMPRAPFGRPVGDAHWPDLHGLFEDPTATTPGQYWGFRTGTTDPALLTLPCSPFTFGQPDRRFWGGTSVLSLDFLVCNNALPWTRQQLFGLLDEFNRPAPFYARVDTQPDGVSVLFVFVTGDGLRREIRIPFDPQDPVLRCSLELDMRAGQGMVRAWVNRRRVSPDLRLINHNWPAADRPGQPGLTFGVNWCASFHLGMVRSLDNASTKIGDNTQDSGLGIPGDLTFGALRMCTTAQYLDLPDQQTAAGPVTDLTWRNGPASGFGCFLPMTSPPVKNPAGLPDLQLPWAAVHFTEHGAASNLSGYGMVAPVLDALNSIVGNSVERLTLHSGSPGHLPDHYGQVIGLGLAIGCSFTDLVVVAGAQGLSCFQVDANYPVDLTGCRFEFQTDTAIYSYFQIGRAHYLALKYWGRTALKASRSTLAYRDVFCTDAQEHPESVVRLFQSHGTFDNWTIDMERPERPPRDSYFWASLGHHTGGPTQLVIRDCQAGTIDKGTVGVRLVALEPNAGLPNSGATDGWCTIERSFTQHQARGLFALVGTDGPVWQGRYEGLLPATVPLALNTSTPGGSARIGLREVPPPVSLPPVSLSGEDLIAGLPGLRCHFRADGLHDLGGPGIGPMPLRDGAPVPQLTDHSGAGNHGRPLNRPAHFVADAVHGHSAVRFNDGHYSFPGIRSDSGAATVFLVGKYLPGFESNPGDHNQGLHTRGPRWHVSLGMYANTATSDTDWVVYAARYNSGAVRLLETWANLRRVDLARRDDVGPVRWAEPRLGSALYGTAYSELAAAVFCDVALGDEQVERTLRHLIHLYGIAV
ncbi:MULTISPECIES: hypothetical protein [unclassified Crossiella]|uniref:hypothetical protein n=1 Tax=unclassified Crossiella TaxID=2620835 RepID=UPI001FFF7AE5|nr:MULTISPECIES: hypothetical protein [unclassified Crossiella]MCK2236272.1 hypothetical protein [Crossiella sp. S99.2]MCK2249939.1 hypothetical protein [Crossiella sp. S99.1]